MLCQLLAAAQYTPERPRPAPAVGSEEWRDLPGAARLIAAGDAALRDARKIPPLPLSDWLAFTQTGDRARYETPYFARRRTLCALVMAECVTDSGRYLPAIADYAWAICGETAWQLPAHNTYRRDTPQLPLPDPARPIIDLFAAETGALLAMVYSLLRERLEAYAPGLARRIRGEVRRRVLRPYLSRHFWWMADTDDAQDTPTCNWTPWCTQNVLIAASVLAPERALPRYVEKAARGLDAFLDGYAPDGCCDEGAQYYAHAALTLYNALELLCALAPGVFEPVWREAKLRNMAEYILHMHVEGPYYLNFADCSPVAGRRGAREYLLGRRVGSAALQALAAHDFAAAPAKAETVLLNGAEGINLYEHIQTAFAEAGILAAGRERVPVPDIWYPGVGILSVRRGAYVLGAKAGGNDDSHNHNDTGSVTLYKDGKPLLIDVGVEQYTKKTFSPRRYEIWTMQSSWHNLPEFDPLGKACQQLPGASARAADVAVAPELDGISMDLAPAYGSAGTVPGLGQYRRSVHLSEQGLQIEDDTDYPGLVALNLMSVEPPTVDGDHIAFGALARAAVTGAARIETQAVPIRDVRMRTAWPDTLYRTRIYFTGALTLTVR